MTACMKARACATATAAAVGLMILMQSQPTKAESCFQGFGGGTLHRWEGRDCEDKLEPLLEKYAKVNNIDPKGGKIECYDVKEYNTEDHLVGAATQADIAFLRAIQRKMATQLNAWKKKNPSKPFPFNPQITPSRVRNYLIFFSMTKETCLTVDDRVLKWLTEQTGGPATTQPPNVRCPAGQYRAGSRPGVCRAQAVCSGDTFLYGAGPTQEGACKPCKSTRCNAPLYRSGECTASTQGYKCKVQPTCFGGQILVGATPLAAGRCEDAPDCSRDEYYDAGSARCKQQDRCGSAQYLKVPAGKPFKKGTCTDLRSCGVDNYLAGATDRQDGECKQCAQSVCPDPKAQFRTGACTADTRGFTCIDQPTCSSGQYLSGGGAAAEGTCTDQPTCAGDEVLTGATRFTKGSCSSCTAGMYVLLGECIDCPPFAACEQGRYVVGVCAGGSDARECRSCKTCASGQYRIGECTNGLDGTECVDQPSCGEGEYLAGGTETAAGTCVSSTTSTSSSTVTTTSASTATTTSTTSSATLEDIGADIDGMVAGLGSGLGLGLVDAEGGKAGGEDVDKGRGKGDGKGDGTGAADLVQSKKERVDKAKAGADDARAKYAAACSGSAAGGRCMQLKTKLEEAEADFDQAVESLASEASASGKGKGKGKGKDKDKGKDKSGAGREGEGELAGAGAGEASVGDDGGDGDSDSTSAIVAVIIVVVLCVLVGTVATVVHQQKRAGGKRAGAVTWTPDTGTTARTGQDNPAYSAGPSTTEDGDLYSDLAVANTAADANPGYMDISPLPTGETPGYMDIAPLAAGEAQPTYSSGPVLKAGHVMYAAGDQVGEVLYAATPINGGDTTPDTGTGTDGMELYGNASVKRNKAAAAVAVAANQDEAQGGMLSYADLAPLDQDQSVDGSGHLVPASDGASAAPGVTYTTLAPQQDGDGSDSETEL